MQHPVIKKIHTSNLSAQEKLQKLIRLAYDSAEMQIADEENMPGANGDNPELDEIVNEINKLSKDKKYKIADFLARK